MSDSLILAYTAIGIMASVVVYTGSLISLKKIKQIKPKRPKNTSGYESDSSSSEEEESESLSSEDAYMFPIFGSISLFSLYLVFKFINKEYINYLIITYISIAGIAAVAKLFNLLVKFGYTKKLVPFKFDFKYGTKDLFNLKFTLINLFTLLLSIITTFSYLFTKHWLLNNLIGISFSLSAIQLIKLDSFKTGLILLSGLFLYDIFWVFGTDVMVTVATKFDAPIKLLWPKSFTPLLEGGKLQFTLLGLGDIVMPGIFVALCLTYDRHLAMQSQKDDPTILKQLQTQPISTTYPKPYFYACMFAYVLGLITTIVVMHTFQAAQPALLYLSPLCSLAPLSVAWYNNGLTSLLEFDADKDNKDKKELEAKKKEEGNSKDSSDSEPESSKDK